MLTQQLPSDLKQTGKRFKGADPAALVVFGVAAGLLAVIFLATYFR